MSLDLVKILIFSDGTDGDEDFSFLDDIEYQVIDCNYYKNNTECEHEVEIEPWDYYNYDDRPALSTTPPPYVPPSESSPPPPPSGTNQTDPNSTPPPDGSKNPGVFIINFLKSSIIKSSKSIPQFKQSVFLLVKFVHVV